MELISFAGRAAATLKTGRTSDIYLSLYAIFVTGVLLWIACVLIKGDVMIMMIILANILTLLFTVPIIFLTLTNKDIAGANKE